MQECCSTKSVVDVYDADSRRARREHRCKRGESAERYAVADARWNGDDRSGDESGDNAWKSAFHAGNHSYGLAGTKTRDVTDDSMDSRDARVYETLDVVTEPFKRKGRLFEDGQIRGSRAHYSDPMSGAFVSAERKRSRNFVMSYVVRVIERLHNGRRTASRQSMPVLVVEFLEYLDSLRFRLVLRKDDLGEAGASMAQMIQMRLGSTVDQGALQ